MVDRLRLDLTGDGVLTVEGHGTFTLPGDALASANAKLGELGLSLDYAWFDTRNGGRYGHAVPVGIPTSVWD